jgi:DnaK suppressor protein
MQAEPTIFAGPNNRVSQESDMCLDIRNRYRERKLTDPGAPHLKAKGHL